MEKETLTGFFEDFLNKESLFLNKKVLQSTYIPETIFHRDLEIKQIANILAPCLKLEKPSNLFVYGKTGCIAGDSLVYTNNGWKKIKNVRNIKDSVLTFNIQTKNYEWSNFVLLKFKNKDELLKITLENGYDLIVTKDHPLLLSNMTWKKSDKLKLNQNLIVSYNLPNVNKKEIPLTMARLLGFMISDGSLNKRKRRVKHWRGTWYNSNKQRCRFFSEDVELLSLVQKDLSQLFECTPQILHPKNRCTHINVVSQEVCTTLNQLGIPFGKKSSIVETPQTILESSNVVQREFLKALFSGDGTVSQHTYMIEYYSNSKKLLQQISYLLHQEGIICKIRPKIAKCNGKKFDSFRLYISSQENLTKFYHKIGFYSISKQEKLQKMLSKYVKNMGFYGKNYFISKITKIEEVYENFVYDLTVSKNHNFIANGVISHNTGKTLTIKHITNNLQKISKQKNVPFKSIYLNCKLKKIADTEYRLVAQLTRELGQEIASTGLPTDEVYKSFFNVIDNQKQLILLVLDEIDQLVKKTGDEILYNLIRINEDLKNAQIAIVGISNDLIFIDHLDPRVRSSLSEEEILFPPYNALQIQEILKQRAKEAFKENVIEEGVIEKCSAYAAREHGDARRALELLRVAAEIAERNNLKRVKIEHIDQAEDKIEKDRVIDTIARQPKQSQATLYAILSLHTKRKENIFTGDIYEIYKKMSSQTGLRPLTQRRISDIIAELDMLGIINAKVISKGRHGRTREISVSIPPTILQKTKRILEEGLALS